jgi:hypothetical protein
MAAAVLFQPVLMGPPRKSGKLPEQDAALLARQGDPNRRAGNAAVPAFAEVGGVLSSSIVPSETSELATTE